MERKDFFIATTRIIALHTGKNRAVRTAIRDIIGYVENPEKTDNGRLIRSYACDSRTADAEFLLAKRQYLTKTGRRRGADDVLAYQIRQSFVPGEITPEKANRLGYELAMRFTKGKHAFLVCTHIDRHHIHNHLIWNAVSVDQTRKFRDFLGSGRAVRRLSDTICLENGYSIVENPQRHGQRYDQWLGEQKLSHREQLRLALDTALAQKPADWDALVKLLQDAGIQVERRGKALRLKAAGWKRFAELDRLGAGYSETELLAILARERTHIPRRRKSGQAEPPKVNLLVDIQAKLQAGKGAGYARWASVFNLKQMAQTLQYLTEHNLLDYAALSARTTEVSDQFQDLSRKIKGIEARMAEVSALKTQIVNYSKTRAVYVAYRKAGYSKKFQAEHESEILLHQSAKKFFDERGLKKLPTVKRLQEESATLLAEKKSLYAAYRRLREERKELLTVQANVDRLLHVEPDKQKHQRSEDR